MQPWFTVYFFDIGHPCYGQLISVKTKYLLTSISWPYRGLKFTDCVYFLSWLLNKCWFSIGLRAHPRLTCWKQGRTVRKPVNTNPGLKVNRIITFSSMQMLFCCFVLCTWWLLKLKTEGQTIYRKPHSPVKLQNSNQNSTFSWDSLIGPWATWPRSYAFRLA